MNVLNFVINDILCDAVILIGLLIMFGYIFQKAEKTKVITGTITGMVGVMIVMFGGSQFTALFSPIALALKEATGMQCYIMDIFVMMASTQEALGDSFGLIGYVFMIAFGVNILLVYFGKYTKARGVFLTSNVAQAQAQAILWLVLVNLIPKEIPAMIIAGVIIGIYWAYSTTICAKAVANATNNAGFTIGQNMQFGIVLFDKIAPYFGSPENDVEKMELPGWLKIFNNNIVSVCAMMWVFVGLLMIPLGWDKILELSNGVNPVIYVFKFGLSFSMNMFFVLQGVKMMCDELTTSFVGIQQKFVPNAIPALDAPAILPYSPNAAMLGFVFCTISTVLCSLLLVVIKSPILVIPGFIPLFFIGGPIGIIANKRGGFKAIVVCTTILGAIQTFGTVWAITLIGYPNAVGWGGMFDFSTFWPLLTEIMKLVSKAFGWT